MKMLNFDDIVLLHKKSIQRYGGSDGIRDKGLVESALARPYATFDGEDLYKDDIDKISVVVYSLIKNHGFVDGNKRIGTLVLLLLCEMNNIVLTVHNDALLKLTLGVADGHFNESDIYRFIQTHRVK